MGSLHVVHGVWVMLYQPVICMCILDAIHMHAIVNKINKESRKNVKKNYERIQYIHAQTHTYMDSDITAFGVRTFIIIFVFILCVL